MDTTKLIAIVTILITLSIATERLVEIIKGFFPKLSQEIPAELPEDTPEKVLARQKTEAWRKAKVSFLAVICGIITAFLASPLLASIFTDTFKNSSCPLFISWFSSLGVNSPCGFNLNFNGVLLILALGLLASGGSSFWNSILEYLLKVKDLKKVDVQKAQALKNIEIERAHAEKEFVLKGYELRNLELKAARNNLPPTENK
jgi:hypothetical protein